jgi:hypothetical protein
MLGFFPLILATKVGSILFTFQGENLLKIHDVPAEAFGLQYC